jgi:sugar phosphate isomerase/epimerase
MSRESGVAIAAENLYPLRPGGTEVSVYAPSWNPVELECPWATLDVSHAAVSGSDVLEMARALGDRLAHVHLGDGTRIGLPDEHLVPGRGTQPCAELLRQLRESDSYQGVVVLEVNTHRAESPAQRSADLAESLAFARRHLEGALADAPA